MKKISALALFLLLSQLIYARDIALLWLPPAGFDPAGITPAGISVAVDCSLSTSSIKSLSQSGNEVVSILPGRPFSSILYFPSSVNLNYINSLTDSPYFFASLLNAEKASCINKSVPQGGFVSLYGDISATQISLFKAMGYLWSPAGDHKQKSECVFEYDGYKIPVFSVFSSTWQVMNSTCPFFLIDDTAYATVSTETLNMLASNPDFRLISVKSAIEISTPSAISKEEISFYPWIGYKEYLNKEELYPYIAALATAKSDIVVFSNSAPKKEKELLGKYMEAEGLIAEIRKTDDLSQKEEEAVEKLSQIYQSMSRPIPGFVYKPFFKKTETAGYLSVSTDNAIIFISQNPLYAVSEFSVSKQEKGGLLFTIRKSTSASLMDIAIYIDINSAVGAGNLSLLNAVREKLYVKNAWDYAIEIRNGRASLYSYSFYSMNKLKTYMISSQSDGFSFKTAPGDLPQNFEKWKYVLINSLNGKIIDGIYRDIDSGSIYPI
ncbi:MAG: hypothetical protein Fur0012_02480 [Elusimicrobiota bacterium]